MPRSRRAWSWRAARSARARRASRTPCCGASRRRARSGTRRCPRGRRGGRAAALAARLDRRAVVRGLRRAAGAGAVRRRQPPAARSRSGRTCAAARPPSRPGSTRPAPWRRDDATGVLRVDGPLDVAGSHAFASGAVVPIARAAVLVAQRVGAAAWHARARPLRGAGRQDGGARGERRAGDGRRRAPGRAKALEATLRRLGVEAEVVTADGASTAAGRSSASSSDAPCSGLGVLAGRPDARWRRTPEDAEELAALQIELVTHAREPAGARRRAALRRLHAQPRGERGDRPGRGPGRPGRAAHVARRGRRRLLRSAPRLIHYMGGGGGRAVVPRDRME